MKFTRQLLTAAMCLLVSTTYSQAEPGPDDIILDLPYGVVLFDFYQQNYFTSLVNLLKAQQDESVPQHAAEAELLRGGLYLSYGMRGRAEEIFKDVLEIEPRQEVKNRAWYYLARIAYQRGLSENALFYLSSIKGELPDTLVGRDQLMAAIINIQQGDYLDAYSGLSDWEGESDIQYYVDYNRGVAALRLGDTDTGTDILDLLGRQKFASEEFELLAVKDRANLAVGLHLLRNEEPEKARFYLDRIRLDGPFANEALLAAGWADARNEFYQPAMIPWNELASRNTLDPAVQESLFAIPYAMAKAGGHKQAAAGYQQALDTFRGEQEKLKASIEDVKAGDYLDVLLSSAEKIEMGWLRELKVVNNAPQPWYLDDLLSSHRVQESLKNYRDLQFLDYNLRTWDESIDSFDEMLSLRERRFDTVVPQAQAKLSENEQENLQNKFTLLNQLYLSATEKEKLRLLATPAELQKLQRLDELQRLIAKHPNARAHEYLLGRVDFLKGILFWDIYNTLEKRERASGRALQDLETEFDQSQEFMQSINALMATLPAGFEGFAAKIQSKRSALSSAHEKLDTVMDKQRSHLTQVVVEELEGHVDRIDELKLQAAFALAQIYDQDSEKDEDDEDEQRSNRGVAR